MEDSSLVVESREDILLWEDTVGRPPDLFGAPVFFDVVKDTVALLHSVNIRQNCIKIQQYFFINGILGIISHFVLLLTWNPHFKMKYRYLLYINLKLDQFKIFSFKLSKFWKITLNKYYDTVYTKFVKNIFRHNLWPFGMQSIPAKTNFLPSFLRFDRIFGTLATVVKVRIISQVFAGCPVAIAKLTADFIYRDKDIT
jgi:hypothetical protein